MTWPRAPLGVLETMTLSRTLAALLALGVLAGAGIAAGLASPPAARTDGDPSPAFQPRASTASHNNSSGGNGTHPPPPNGTHPLPAPVVSPERQSVVARYGGAAGFEVVVSNHAGRTQQVTITAHAPLGWTTTLHAYDRTLSPGESVNLSGEVRALSPYPTRGNVTLVVQGEDAAAYATVHVCFLSPLDACAPPNGTQPPPNGTRPPPKNETGGTKPPANETGGNQTQPPRNETGGGNQTRPPSNETQPPGNDTAEASASPILLGEPDPGLPALHEEREARADARLGQDRAGGGEVVAAVAVKRSPTLI